MGQTTPPKHNAPRLTRRSALAGMGLAIAGVPLTERDSSARQDGRTGPASGLVQWVWSGGVTATSAVVVAALADGMDEAHLRISHREELSGSGTVGPSNPGADVLRFEIAGLTPDTTYWYAVARDEDIAADIEPDGKFRTFPEGAATFTFAFSACAETGSNADVFHTIREEAPLFFLSTGDFVYADIEENETDLFREAFDITLTSPAQSALYRSVPIAYIWDDHDFGPNNSDRTSPGREAAQKNYRALVPHYSLAGLDDDGAIAQTFTVGRARFIMTDNYSYRDPDDAPDGPEKTMLGAAQKDWLKQELLASNGTYPVIVWVNSQPWISVPGSDGDGWGPFATEREEISRFIVDNDIRGLVMLSGDAHMLAIDNGSNSNYAVPGQRGFPVFHAAALDRDGSVKGGPYSEGTFPGRGQYGLMTIEDGSGPSIEIKWSGRNEDGDEIVRYQFRLDADGASPPPTPVG